MKAEIYMPCPLAKICLLASNKCHGRDIVVCPLVLQMLRDIAVVYVSGMVEGETIKHANMTLRKEGNRLTIVVEGIFDMGGRS